MDKNLRLNRIFRILAGIYLLYLSTSLWREIDQSGNKIVGTVFIIIFAAIGIVFIILSTRDLIRMKKERTDEIEETEDKEDEPIDEMIEEKDDTEDLVSDDSESYDDTEVIADNELNHENDISDDGVDDSSDSNVIDNIKDHTQD